MDIPKHIAIIMDGNGRWASQRLLSRIKGHKQGAQAVRSVVKHCAQLGVEALTLFAFSSENIKRPKDEVSALFSLFLTVLKSEADKLNEANVRLSVIGDVSIFDDELRRTIASTEAKLSNNNGLDLIIAANYGGKWDIVRACQRMAQQVAAGALATTDIDEHLFNTQMSLSAFPAVDLLIRTSGEVRLSNFLLWDLAYSEFYFTQTLWPDFDSDDLDEAIAVYGKRKRRFGAN